MIHLFAQDLQKPDTSLEVMFNKLDAYFGTHSSELIRTLIETDSRFINNYFDILRLEDEDYYEEDIKFMLKDPIIDVNMYKGKPYNRTTYAQLLCKEIVYLWRQCL